MRLRLSDDTLRGLAHLDCADWTFVIPIDVGPGMATTASQAEIVYDAHVEKCDGQLKLY
jgi:pentose-5-phosphate-3-epimerase